MAATVVGAIPGIRLFGSLRLPLRFAAWGRSYKRNFQVE